MIRRYGGDLPLLVTVRGEDGRKLSEIVADPDNLAPLQMLPEDAHDYSIEVPNGEEVVVRLTMARAKAATRYHQLMQAVAAADVEDVPNLIGRAQPLAQVRPGGDGVRLGLWLAPEAAGPETRFAPTSPELLRPLLGQPMVKEDALEYRLGSNGLAGRDYRLLNIILGCGESLFARLPPAGTPIRLLVKEQAQPEIQAPRTSGPFPLRLLGDRMSSAYYDFLHAGSTRAAKRVGAELANRCAAGNAPLSHLLTAAHWAIRFATPDDERIPAIYAGLKKQLDQPDAAVLEWVLSYDNPHARETSGWSGVAEIGTELGRRLRLARTSPPVFTATLRLLIERTDYFSAEPSAEDDLTGRGWTVAEWKQEHADCLSWVEGMRRAVRWDLEFTTYRATRPDVPDPTATVEDLSTAAREALVSCQPIQELPTTAEDLADWITVQNQLLVTASPLHQVRQQLAALAQTLVSALEERHLQMAVVRSALQMAISKTKLPVDGLRAISEIFTPEPLGRRRLGFPCGPIANEAMHSSPWEVSVPLHDGDTLSVVIREGQAPPALTDPIYEDALATEAALPPDSVFAYPEVHGPDNAPK